VSESKHYFRLKGVAPEAVVQDLAVRSFFTDWCYPNPTLADGKELCDLLIVFDRVVIIFQIKNLKLGPDGRYSRNEVNKNIRQLSGARRQMFNLKRPISLTNPRRGVEVFDPSTVQEVYLISVLAGEGEAVFPAVEAIKDNTAHVFTSSFVETALTELDTVADFVQYLKAKEALLQKLNTLLIIGGEEELLAHYLTQGRTFDALANVTDAVLEEGCWAALQEKPEYKAKKRADETSYGWDRMIDRVHERGSLQYERLARELARPSRFERRVLSRVFFEAHKMAYEDSVHDVVRRVLPTNGRTYCFIFADDPEPRDRRKAMLLALCFVARGKYKENATVIGIATEKKLRPECTYDYYLLEMPEWSEEDDRRVEQIQRETGILTNVMLGETHEDEYPSDDRS
jgi:hypothetical protein